MEDIECYGHSKYDWLKTFLELPNGIPSNDTFRRVFILLSPDAFRNCFINWVESIKELLPNNVVSIDGKTLRGSLTKKMVNLESIWWCMGIRDEYGAGTTEN